MTPSFNTQTEIEALLALPSSDQKQWMDAGEGSVAGLRVQRRKNAQATWVLKYSCLKTLSWQSYKMGSFKSLTLVQARALAFEFLQVQSLQVLQHAQTQQALSRPGAKSTSKASVDSVTSAQDLVRAMSQREDPCGLLFVSFVDAHYLPYIQSVKRSWRTDVSLLKNHLLPRFGTLTMQAIRPFMVQDMLKAMLNAGMKPSSCNRVLILLRFIFNCALKWELLSSGLNPCVHIKELRVNNQQENFLTAAQLKTLQKELAKSRNPTLPYVVQLMILTGCRRGEVLRAKTQDFDLVRGDWVVPVPKSGQRRHIPLSPLALETVWAALSFKSEQSQSVRESEYLFANPQTGRAFVQIFFSWDKARKAANLEHFRMHDLRHSFASAMVNSGMTLYDVKQILGHSNIKTTQRYAHLSNERLKAAASSVVDYFESPSVLVLDLKPTDLSENLDDALSHAPKVAAALRPSPKGQK